MKYDIDADALDPFERKPGVWDPIVGLGWHTERRTCEVHPIFEGGGFGVGADLELAASLRADWKPIPHFGFTGGYQFLYFKISDTVLGRDVHGEADPAGSDGGRGPLLLTCRSSGPDAARMTTQQAVMLALQASILLIVFGFGLQTTLHDLQYLVAAPGPAGPVAAGDVRHHADRRR